MEATHKKPKNFIEWLNADKMHLASKHWLSELNFIKVEQLFLDDLIKSYTLQLIDKDNFSENKKIIDELSKLQKQNAKLTKIVIEHEKGLQIMVDGIDQFTEEENYKNKHRQLIISVTSYLKKYKNLKKGLFEMIKSVLKFEKQGHLLQ